MVTGLEPVSVWCIADKLEKLQRRFIQSYCNSSDVASHIGLVQWFSNCERALQETNWIIIRLIIMHLGAL